jgi:hypothetical protein
MLKPLAAFHQTLTCINLRSILSRPTVQQTLELLVVEYFQVRSDNLRPGPPINEKKL